MLIAGIIAEYNPFHNGHLYQLQTIRKTLAPDLVVAVLSGDFTQRGEPAIVSKWERTRMALEGGIDLVIELPYIFSVARADVFARGAVSVLDNLGVNRLIFGSENGRIEPFMRTLSLIDSNRRIYEQTLMQSLNKGISYPNAHAAAYRRLAQSCPEELVDLTQPNNSLGFHYIRAIRERKSRMIPMTICRKESDHRELILSGEGTIASARSIRASLLDEKENGHLRTKMPLHVYHVLMQKKKSQQLADWEAFFPFLKYRLLVSTASQLSKIYEMEEGIENRLLAAIRAADHFHTFISAMKTKRYTWARLQRLSVHVLTNTMKKAARTPADAGDAPYLRLLGMNRAGQAYLSHIRKQLQIPLVAKIRKVRDPLLDMDIKAALLYDYVTKTGGTGIRSETGHPPIRYDEENRQFSE
ncbi:nucleotidyltransferase [Sporolactobacillus sp. THM7-7]|nr:nucleotidyltransferase [Sporolactobacillus sp. THM7-7]